MGNSANSQDGNLVRSSVAPQLPQVQTSLRPPKSPYGATIGVDEVRRKLGSPQAGQGSPGFTGGFSNFASRFATAFSNSSTRPGSAFNVRHVGI